MEKTTAKLIVTSSPHITSKSSVRSIMLDVIIALIPATIAATYFFGLYTLLMTVLCIGTCYFTEFLFNKLTKRFPTSADLSAVVTGLLLGLNLPPRVPFYIPVIGGIVAILIVKLLFGGIGKNFANPAITARIFLLLCFQGVMASFPPPLKYTQGNAFEQFFRMWSLNPETVAGATASATPLSQNYPLWDLFIGNIGGSAGETCKFALLLGGIYLIVRKVIDYKIPLTIIAGTALLTLIDSGSGRILPDLLSGGLIIGAFFMATDYSSSPNTNWGRVVFAAFIALLTFIIRKYSYMPEGISYAILLANLLVPIIDKYIYPRPLGRKELLK